MLAPRWRSRPDEVVVPAVHVLESRDGRLAVGDEPGEDQRRRGADVTGVHRGAREVIDAADHGVVALGRDARAESNELIDVAKSSDEQVLGDDRDAVGDAQHRRDERFVVGRHARIRQRRHVTGTQHSRPLGGDAGSVHIDDATHRLDLSQQHLHVLGVGVDDAHLPAGDETRREIRRADDAVGDDLVARRVAVRRRRRWSVATCPGPRCARPWR